MAHIRRSANATARGLDRAIGLGALAGALVGAGLGIGLCACTAEATTSDIVEPPFDGKADLADSVTPKGALAYGEAVEGAFTSDLEFHAYTFAAVAAADVTLEVTHLGSSSTLDTTLFVFGPRDSEGGSGPRLATDNDSGYGKLSKVSVSTAGQGTYTVVIGTADGLGRGHYRLELRCDHADATTCAPAAPPVGGLHLIEQAPPGGIVSVLEDGQSYCSSHDDYCFIRGTLYGFDDSGATVEGAAEGYRAIFSRDVEPTDWSYASSWRSAIDAALVEMDLQPEQFESGLEWSESDYVVGKVDTAYACGPSVDCLSSIFCMFNADQKSVFVLEVGYTSE